jgi:hypothetical protein
VSDADCGFRFVVGETYIVYGSKDDSGLLRTSICTRTRRASGHGEADPSVEIAQLDEAAKSQ